MNKPNKRTKEKNRIRKDSFTVVTILTYIGSLLYRIFLCRMIGEKGVGYFSIANEIYVIITFLFAYGLSESVSSLVRYRMKREQYKNTEKVRQSAVLLAVILGSILGVCFLFGGQFFAAKVAGIPLAGLSVSLMAPSAVFILLVGVYRGYFQGNGSFVPSIYSKIIEGVFVIAGGIIGTLLFYQYGEKVSALLQNEDYAPSYGAMGASVGFLTASIISFLYMLFLKLIYHRKIYRQILQDTQRSQDSRIRIFQVMARSGVPYAIYGFLFHVLPLADVCLYFHLTHGNAANIVLWGNYYGKYMVVIGIIGSALLLALIEPIKRIVLMTDREEYRTARERLAYLIHQTALYVFPAAVLTAVFSENILNILFEGSNLKTEEWVAWGSIGMVFYVFALLFMNLLIRLKKMKYVLGSGCVALLFYGIVSTLLLQKTQLNVLALVIGNIVFYAILMGVGFGILVRYYQYRQEWVKSVAFTAVCAGITGLICMLLNQALIGLVGSTISLIICIPIGICIYIILVILTRSVTVQDMENIVGGKILYKIAGWLHFL